jgi:hypothetical protein
MGILLNGSWLWIAMGVVFVALVLRFFLRPKAPVTAGGWWGPFYVNPADPALFVPKRWVLIGRWARGYTLNFGNRWAWVILAAMVVLTLVPLWYVIVALQQAFTLPSN